MATPSPATYCFKTVDGLPIHADVFLPTSTSTHSLPVLLWWHGGGLLMSSRATIGPHLRRAAEKYKMAVVSADYRLAPQAPIPQIMEDVRDAASWVRDKLPGILGEGVIDPARLIVGGHSAGGYLALLSASPKIGITPPPKAVVALYPITNPRGPFFTTAQRPVSGIPNDRIIAHEEMARHIDPSAAILSGSTPPCFPPPHGDRGELYLYMVQEALLEKLLFGKAPDAEVEDYIPAKFWSKASPPTWIYHGQVDNRVGIEQSLTLVQAIKDVGAPYVFEEIPRPKAQHLFDHFDPAEELESMYAFIKQHFDI
ncbi:Alpha/Beta hydrolase protein [Leucosporidium creatinivorum]|uniref:Alpha/Beta hydrolase protein n=1 Tax=Leucosporidium creatinivorum TaxID=106004 RepID=A0A1Y2FCX9_9BASI|nr:Alpha/Beta hydrolase protein [Leucosporidium creatinivorum]